MAKKEQLVTGVDIGSHAVKICLLQKSGREYKLLKLGSANLPVGAVEDGILQEPDAVSKVISTLFKNLKIKNTEIGISISGYSVIVKKINLEVMDDDELAEYIKAEAEQYIPFDIEDVYLDFQKIPIQGNNDRNDVMIVAAKKEVINDYLKMLEQLKMKVVLVDVDGFALENIWETTIDQIENVALVDIGASKMNINVISDGISVLARDVVVGSEQLTEQIANAIDVDYSDAEKVKLGILEAEEEYKEKIERIFMQTCTQWVLEIKKAIDLYSANYPDKPLRSIVLSGGGSKVDGLVDFIARETNLRVINFNPFRHMLIDEKKIDRSYLDSVAPEMSIAAGIAIRQVNL